MRLVEKRKDKPEIQEVFALQDIPRAQALLDSRQVFGKLLVDPTLAA